MHEDRKLVHIGCKM